MSTRECVCAQSAGGCFGLFLSSEQRDVNILLMSLFSLFELLQQRDVRRAQHVVDLVDLV